MLLKEIYPVFVSLVEVSCCRGMTPPILNLLWVFTGLAAIEINGQKTRFFGADMVACFLKRIQACSEIP